MNCIMENTSVVPSSNFVDFIHRASRICLGQSAKALVWRWRQICPLKIDIFTLSAPNSTNEVFMFKLAIKVCFENHFGLIHAIFLSLASTKSGYFFLGHPVYIHILYISYYFVFYHSTIILCIIIMLLSSSILLCLRYTYLSPTSTYIHPCDAA